MAVYLDKTFFKLVAKKHQNKKEKSSILAVVCFSVGYY